MRGMFVLVVLLGLEAAAAPSSDVVRGAPLFPVALADEREPRTCVRYLREAAEHIDSDVVMFGLADRFEFVRWGFGSRGRCGLVLSGGAFARFDASEPSFDFLDIDFSAGMALEARSGTLAGRVRAYHESSHLGDDFLGTRDAWEESAFDFEAIEGAGSFEWHWVRLYGGAEHRFRSTPSALDPHVAFAGLELRSRHAVLQLGSRAQIRPVLGVQWTGVEEREWVASWAGRLGLEVARADQPSARRLFLLLEGFAGPSSRGQFYAEDAAFVGVGLHIVP